LQESIRLKIKYEDFEVFIDYLDYEHILT